MRIGLVLLMIGVSAATAGAEDVKAGRAAVLRRDKSTMSPKVAEIKKDQVLAVAEKSEVGKTVWIRTTIDSKQGWVSMNEIKPSGGFDLGKMANAISGSSQADAASDSAAAKGVEPITLEYSKGKHYDTAGLDRLVKLRKDIIDSGEFDKFSQEGNVGSYRK